LTEITDQDVITLFKQPSHDLNSWMRWPVIFEKGSKIYFVLLSEDLQKSINRGIKVYFFDRENKKLNLEEDKMINLGTRCSLWGIYPINSNFMLIGRCNYFCLRYTPLFLLLATPPTFYHNTSFLLESNKDSDKELIKQPIEEPGCYNVKNQVYDVSPSGAIQAAWVRNTTGVVLKHDETIYLSTNSGGAHWSNPIELYSVKNTEVINNQINNLSLASYGNSSYVLWQDREKGIFFSELNNGKKSELTQLSDMKEVSFTQPLELATRIKVAADNNGNAYALWIENSSNDYTSYDYKVYFRARINGQWMPEIIINKGAGLVTLPDMKVDKEGNVHITCIKSISKNVSHSQYGCFYMKLERQDKKNQITKQ
jgi:hypothetical protein